MSPATRGAVAKIDGNVMAINPGIIGNDCRYYILDLLHTFPPNVNFLKLEGMEAWSTSKISLKSP